jgi:hypothetical protein
MRCGKDVRDKPGAVIGVLAVLTTASVFAALRWQTAQTTAAAGFSFDDGAFALPPAIAARLGGPLTGAEIESIKSVSRAELTRAFAGWRLTLADRRDAFWRVEVVQTIRPRGALPNVGGSVDLGMFGGSGAVGFSLVTAKAIHYAPPGAPRDTIIAGIGRGIGRVAVHELAHQILGASAPMHDRSDDHSYEYPTPDRASQYYGELHWTVARPLLEQRLGR